MDRADDVTDEITTSSVKAEDKTTKQKKNKKNQQNEGKLNEIIENVTNYTCYSENIESYCRNKIE